MTEEEKKRLQEEYSKLIKEFKRIWLSGWANVEATNIHNKMEMLEILARIFDVKLIVE